MKNKVTIQFGASKWNVIVNDGKGNPVVFDLYHMSKDQRRQFHREFMKAYRAS
ncbi:hypothetical protein [Bradyrhizobium sp. BR 10289]|uniref:hypothetical protein n=1 Tax=Bradyrhizobium sp. BR 10289 TaxID=2749993 RepID=UPI001C6471E1|nr:hypothetical protein [Bradyrhizobium sp. BR 10289]MBW7970986.1 hypothetical protein [Bradyrhizobium sp. BR 10289]